LLKYDTPKWFRAVQIGSGLVSLILSSLVLSLGFPTVSADIIVTVLSVALLSIGIERILLGLLVFRSTSAPTTRSHTKKKFIPDLALGALALIFASIALISPATVMGIPAVLLSISISVMFNGFGRLFQGAMAKGQGRLFRLVSLGLGALSVGAAIFVSNSHIFGIIFPIRVLLVVLLIHGLAMTLFGIFGRLSLEQVLRNRGVK
jgi:hypothetical protein